MKREFLINITMENAQCIATVCNEIKSQFDVYIDIKYGRQIIDGSSVLGVYSLVNHLVIVCPVTDDEEVLRVIFDKFVPLGAFN